MKKKTVLAFLALLPLFAFAPRADGAPPNCTFNSVTGVSFGAYDVFGTGPLRAVGSIAYTCTKLPGPQTVTIDLSTGSSGRFTNRTLGSGPSNVLNYNLYPDASYSQAWGDGTSGTYHYNINPVDGQLYNLTVYGTIPAGQNAAVGSYTDSITVTMSF